MWFDFLFKVITILIVGNKAKGQISKRVFQESKARQIFRKTNNSYPKIRNVRFFGKFGVFCFLETSVLRFALLPYYRRNHCLLADGSNTPWCYVRPLWVNNSTLNSFWLALWCFKLYCYQQFVYVCIFVESY